MDKLDGLVTCHVADSLLHPERMGEILSMIAEQRADKAAVIDDRAGAMAREVADAEERLRRLYRLVEDGVAEFDGALKERIANLLAGRDAAAAALARLKSGSRDSIRPTSEMIGRFGASMREHLTSGDVTFRKAYLGALIDRVEAGDRIRSRKDVLEQCVIGGAKPDWCGAVVWKGGQ